MRIKFTNFRNAWWIRHWSNNYECQKAWIKWILCYLKIIIKNKEIVNLLSEELETCEIKIFDIEIMWEVPVDDDEDERDEQRYWYQLTLLYLYNIASKK